MDALSIWYPIMMAANFAELDLAGDVPLLDYLSAVGKANLRNIGAKQRRLDGLVQTMRFGEWHKV